ncbi:hypothetical protein ACIA5C_19565 [Actinoplanes sp. NPDC051343]|uniref:CdiA C-terminal domain-containing protein n=1 Tax=Actinoplanes sp. NPDC051343 TaxID=3363906 RepID=UPI0037A97D6E
MRANQEALAVAAKSGRPGRSSDLVTVGSGPTGGRPEGPPTRIGAKQDDDVKRSLDRENSAAVTLADQGFRVQQNPTRAEVAQARAATGDLGKPTSDPDYLLEGRVFDCYSPSAAKSVRGIWSEVDDKVRERTQTQRVVINMEDWTGDFAALRRQFADWTIPGLKEAKAITPDGDIVQLDLHPDND